MKEDYMQVSGTMCFLKNEGKVLFVYRGRKNDLHKGTYIPPGGHTKPGERGIDCIVREFEEETGLTLVEPRLRVLATFYNKDRVMGGKKDPDDWKVEVYEADKFNGRLKEEHKECPLIWIQEAEINNLKMYLGDKRIWTLMKREGIYEVRTKYQGKRLTDFKATRVG